MRALKLLIAKIAPPNIGHLFPCEPLVRCATRESISPLDAARRDRAEMCPPVSLFERSEPYGKPSVEFRPPNRWRRIRPAPVPTLTPASTILTRSMRSSLIGSRENLSASHPANRTLRSSQLKLSIERKNGRQNCAAAPIVWIAREFRTRDDPTRPSTGCPN